jgi:hypothetical protein
MPSIRNYQWGKDVFGDIALNLRQLFSPDTALKTKESDAIIVNPLFFAIASEIKNAGIDREALYPADMNATEKGTFIVSMATRGTGIGRTLRDLFIRPSSLLIFPPVIKTLTILIDSAAQLWRVPIELAAKSKNRPLQMVTYALFTGLFGGWALNLASAGAKFIDRLCEKLVNKPTDKAILGEKAFGKKSVVDEKAEANKNSARSLVDSLKTKSLSEEQVKELRQIIPLSGEEKAKKVAAFLKKGNFAAPKIDSGDDVAICAHQILYGEISDPDEQAKLKTIVLPNIDIMQSVAAYKSFKSDQIGDNPFLSAIKQQVLTSQVHVESASTTSQSSIASDDTLPLLKKTFHSSLARDDLKRIRITDTSIQDYHATKRTQNKTRGECIPVLADRLLNGPYFDHTEIQQLELLVKANPKGKELGKKGRYQIVDELDKSHTAPIAKLEGKYADQAKVIIDWLAHRPLPKKARAPFILLIHGIDKDGNRLDQSHREKAISMIVHAILEKDIEGMNVKHLHHVLR